MYEMHEEREKTRSYQWIEDHTRPKINWVWGLKREKSVWEKLDSFSVKRDMKKMRFDFALKLYKEIAARWIEICWEFFKVLSRIYRREKNLNGLNNFREAIEKTETFSMDWESVEKLSRQILESFDGSKMR